MEPKDYRELISFTEEELMDYYKKTKKDPTPVCFDVLKTMLSAIVKAEKIVAMREEGGYSEGNGWNYAEESGRRGMSRDGGQSGRRYSGEDGNDGGQSGRRYSREGSYDGGQSGRRYSREDGGNSYHGDGELYDYLKRKVRSEDDAGRRSAFEDMLRMMDRG